MVARNEAAAVRCGAGKSEWIVDLLVKHNVRLTSHQVL